MGHGRQCPAGVATASANAHRRVTQPLRLECAKPYFYPVRELRLREAAHPRLNAVLDGQVPQEGEAL